MISINFALSGALAILVGLLILVWPKLLRLALGIYLVVAGLLQIVSFG